MIRGQTVRKKKSQTQCEYSKSFIVQRNDITDNEFWQVSSIHFSLNKISFIPREM